GGPRAHGQSRRHRAGGGGGDLLGEPPAIVEGPAVVILAAVGDGAPELLDEVPAVTGDLDPIPPAAGQALGGAGEPRDDIGDLTGAEHVRDFSVNRLGHLRWRADRDPVAQGVPAPPQVRCLRHHQASADGHPTAPAGLRRWYARWSSVNRPARAHPVPWAVETMRLLSVRVPSVNGANRCG